MIELLRALISLPVFLFLLHVYPPTHSLDFLAVLLFTCLRSLLNTNWEINPINACAARFSALHSLSMNKITLNNKHTLGSAPVIKALAA